MELTQESLNEMLTILAAAPDSQIDKSITATLKTLIGKDSAEIKPILLKCIQDSQYAALASDFSIRVMMDIYMLLGGDSNNFLRPTVTEIKL